LFVAALVLIRATNSLAQDAFALALFVQSDHCTPGLARQLKDRVGGAGWHGNARALDFLATNVHARKKIKIR
jgi:hypothetical protein